MLKKVFVYIWEYTVKDDCIMEFERMYGPEGNWVELFKRSKGFIATDLHQDISNRKRFITVDIWNSKEDRDSFRKSFSKEFEQLDEQCERFTERETLIGDFESTLNRI